MPAPSTANMKWPRFSVRGEVAYIRAADNLNDRMREAAAADPNLVFLGASPKDTGLPGFGGEIRADFRSNLPEAKAVDAARALLERELGELRAVSHALEDVGDEVVAPTIAEAKDVVREATSWSKWIVVAVVAYAALKIVPALLSSRGKAAA